MSIDASIFVWLFIGLVFLVSLRAVWSVVVFVLGVLVAGIILVFMADALSGGTAIAQVAALLASQFVPFVLATAAAISVWLRRVFPPKTTTKYDL